MGPCRLLFESPLLLIAVALLAGCQHSELPSPLSPPSTDSAGLPAEATRQIDFATEVKPILSHHCLPCHHRGTLLSDFHLETREQAFGYLGRGDEKPIVPDSPETSGMWEMLMTPHPLKQGEDAMPSNGPRLTDEEKNIIYRWIEQGAEWPEGEAGRLQPIKVTNQA